LATEAFSAVMKVASITETAIIHGFAEGFQSRCSSSALRAVLWEALNGSHPDPPRFVCQ
jgi:hypothetical protein